MTQQPRGTCNLEPYKQHEQLLGCVDWTPLGGPGEAAVKEAEQLGLDLNYLQATGLAQSQFTSVLNPHSCPYCGVTFPNTSAWLGHSCTSWRPGAVPTGEVVVEDPNTGGRKGKKLAMLGAICPRALMEVAEVAGFGADKYERYNFLKGYDYSLSYDALQRHLNAWWGGQDLDPESGKSHLAHAAWHCLALLAFKLRGKGNDDRPLD